MKTCLYYLPRRAGDDGGEVALAYTTTEKPGDDHIGLYTHNEETGAYTLNVKGLPVVPQLPEGFDSFEALVAAATQSGQQERIAELEGELAQFKDGARLSAIEKLVKASPAVASAHADILELLNGKLEMKEGGALVTDTGTDAATFLSEYLGARPHLLPPSNLPNMYQGQGNSDMANNPWTAEKWNMTEQGRLYRQNPEKARRLAAMAGHKL